MRQSAGKSMKYETKMRRRYAVLRAYSKEQTDLRKGFWCILIFMFLAGRVSYFTIFQNHTVSVYAAAQTEQQEDPSIQIQQSQIDDIKTDIADLPVSENIGKLCQYCSNKNHK